MERLTMTDKEINEIRQYCSDFNCPIKAEEDSVTQRFCDRVCDEFQGNCPFMNVGLKLKEYEDAEEQGLLLRLPCKVGDTVWCIVSAGTKVVGCKVMWIEKHRDGILVFSLDGGIGDVILAHLGKKWFLTKEEAEQALKQMGE